MATRRGEDSLPGEIRSQGKLRIKLHSVGCQQAHIFCTRWFCLQKSLALESLPFVPMSHNGNWPQLLVWTNYLFDTICLSFLSSSIIRRVANRFIKIKRYCELDFSYVDAPKTVLGLFISDTMHSSS